MFFEITKNEDVVATGAEGIVEHRHGPEENFGVFTLRLKGHDHLEVLAHADHDVTGDPDLITRVNARGGADLILPLAGHNLTVDARDVETSINTGLQMGVSDLATIRAIGTGGTIIGSLGAGETVGGPAEGRAAVFLEQGVFLFNAEPGEINLKLNCTRFESLEMYLLK